MIQIQLNGKPYKIDEKMSVSDLLSKLSLTEKKVAVEINEEILPRENYNKKILSVKDKVEIVHFIGGG
jgi:sulfur carrier protein